MNLRNAKRSEDTEQILVFQWAKWNTSKYPCLKWIHHIPNGGSRNKVEAAKLKQMGVRSGVSDIFLPAAEGRYHGLYIEMKFGNGRHQESQKEFLRDMAAAGYYVATCYTAEDAIKVIKEYCGLKKNMVSIVSTDMEEKNNSIWKDGTVKAMPETKGEKGCKKG